LGTIGVLFAAGGMIWVELLGAPVTNSRGK
jgi:hypothetical protein